MSGPLAETPKRRPRRQFTDDFKAGAARLVFEEGRTVSAAAVTDLCGLRCEGRSR
jgi:hypothetical protein